MGILHPFSRQPSEPPRDPHEHRTLRAINHEVAEQGKTLKRIEALLIEAVKTPEQRKAEARAKWEKELVFWGLRPSDFDESERP